MTFAGIDMAIAYPGDHVMQSLWDETNLFWVGLYLAVKDRSEEATRNRKTWVGKFQRLKTMGWGVAPLYVGKQVSTIASLVAHAAQMGGKSLADFEGANDGDEAAGLATEQSMPPGTVLYFDLEKGGAIGDTLPAVYLSYLEAWCRTVLARQFTPGIYCSSGFGALISTTMATRLGTASAMSSVWIADTNKHQHERFADPFPSDGLYHPSMSGFGKATAWQYAHQKTIHVPKTRQPIPVDVNSSIRKDPGRL